MGNASIKMEEEEAAKTETKPMADMALGSQKYESKKTSSKSAGEEVLTKAVDDTPTPTAEISEKSEPLSSNTAALSKPSKRQVQDEKSRAAISISVEEEEDEVTDDFDILVQFIPYYQEGDPSNDILVRSTLMNVSDSDLEKVLHLYN